MRRCLVAVLAIFAAAPAAIAADRAIDAAYFLLEGASVAATSDDEVVTDTEPPPGPSGVRTFVHVRVTRVGRCVFERRQSRAILGDNGERRIFSTEFNRVDFARFRTLTADGPMTIAEGEEGFSCWATRSGLGEAESLLVKPEPLECGDGLNLISAVTGKEFDRKLAEQAIERLRKEQCFR